MRAVLATVALPPGFAKVVDSAVAARNATFAKVKAVSEGTLAEREKRLNEVYLAERMSKADYDREWQAITDQRATLKVKPSPPFTQQQSILTTLVDAWEGANADEKKRALAGIFDRIVASADGVDRLEPCEDWRPFMVAAIPKPVKVPTAPAGATGAEDGTLCPQC